MASRCTVIRVGAALSLLVLFAAGCGQTPQPGPARPKERPAFTGSNGYKHEPTAVAFVYPDPVEWEQEKPRSIGPVVTMSLGKRDHKGSALVSWSEDSGKHDLAASARFWREMMRKEYKDAVSEPEEVTVNGRKGYRLKTTAGPEGKPEQADRRQVVYLFGVENAQGGKSWTVKLIVTAPSPDVDRLAEELVNHFHF